MIDLIQISYYDGFLPVITPLCGMHTFNKYSTQGILVAGQSKIIIIMFWSETSDQQRRISGARLWTCSAICTNTTTHISTIHFN